MTTEPDESPPPGAKKTGPHRYTVIMGKELIDVEDLGPNTIPRYTATDESGRTFFHDQLTFIITPPPSKMPQKPYTVKDPSTLLQLL
ncbi:MAG: hypothetical protein JRN21_09830 [Nitrososphaerota archaeon]|nr:hypothetical protein [Nitrososphaerota archaeon]